MGFLNLSDIAKAIAAIPTVSTNTETTPEPRTTPPASPAPNNPSENTTILNRTFFTLGYGTMESRDEFVNTLHLIQAGLYRAWRQPGKDFRYEVGGDITLGITNSDRPNATYLSTGRVGVRSRFYYSPSLNNTPLTPEERQFDYRRIIRSRTNRAFAIGLVVGVGLEHWELKGVENTTTDQGPYFDIGLTASLIELFFGEATYGFCGQGGCATFSFGIKLAGK